MDDLKLIARIAGQDVALSAEAIESVVEIDAITPVPLAAAHIAGLAALRSRVLTLIDTYAALELGRSPRDGVMQAIARLDARGARPRRASGSHVAAARSGADRGGAAFRGGLSSPLTLSLRSLG
jgi:hypothetical protein